MSKYYQYRQNNSGGIFYEPAIEVWVKATTAQEADSIAEANGVYFDGVGDCWCCGDRWHRASDFNSADEVSTWDQPDWLPDEFYSGVPKQLVIEGASK